MTVALTDIGVIAPGAVGTAQFLNLLQSNETALRPIADGANIASRLHIAGSIEEVSHSISRIRQLAQGALSQLDVDRLQGQQRCGLVFASAINGTLEIDAAYADERQQSPSDIRFGVIADEVAEQFFLDGPSFTVSTGCAASLDALGIAYDQIATGKADKMIVLTAEATLSPIVFAAFDQIGALSRASLAGEASQPFGTARNGFVLAEGSAAVVLEKRPACALPDADYAIEMVGWHSVNNAYHMTSLKTDGSDLIRLVRELLENVGLTAADIGLIDFHGTSTKINDLAESEMFRAVFGQLKAPPICTAQKSYVGHSLGASNLIEVVGLSLMLSRQFACALPTYALLDISLGVPFLHKCKTDTGVRYGIKISSSFSGIHTAAVFKAHRIM